MVFEDPLVNLVEEIWCEASEYVTVREVMPEWLINGTYSFFFKLGWFLTTSMFIQGVEGIIDIPRQGFDRTATVIWDHQTVQAPVLHTASYKTLLGVIGNICRQDGMNTAHVTVGTYYLHSYLPSFNDGCQKL